jgi:hypothetical protein
VWNQWRDKIGARTDYNLFNREWVYVEYAWLSSSRITFYVNGCRNRLDGGPFDVRIEITEMATGKRYIGHKKDAEIKTRIDVDLAHLSYPADYGVRLYIDDNIAYAGQYGSENLPF